MSNVSFDVTPEDALTIRLIVARADAMSFGQGMRRMKAAERLAVTMDITAVHANGNPLDLDRWLDANDFNFAHDFNGIAEHLDRTTGKLLHCFSPRFSLPEPDRTSERWRAAILAEHSP